MSLTLDDVNRLAKLARLELPPERAQQTLAQLNPVLSLIEQLQAVDTQGVEPMTHPIPMALRLRPDEVTEHDQREHYQKPAPALEQGLYLVPKVIE